MHAQKSKSDRATSIMGTLVNTNARGSVIFKSHNVKFLMKKYFITVF